MQNIGEEKKEIDLGVELPKSEPIPTPELQKFIDMELFRMEAAKDAMNGMLSAPQFWQNVWSYNPVNGKCNYPRQIALFAIACADELIKQLKEEKK